MNEGRVITEQFKKGFQACTARWRPKRKKPKPPWTLSHWPVGAARAGCKKN